MDDLGKAAYEEFQFFWAPTVSVTEGAVDGPTWGQLPDQVKECWRQVADAVIAASRFDVKR